MTPPKCQVLCVDDNDDTCFMLSTLLGPKGYEVTTAGSVEAAKRAVLGTRFDLAILDNRIADGTGVDLCAWMREQSPDTRIIFYSAVAFQSDRDEGMCAGAAAYVAKPGIAGLLAAVNGVLRDETRSASAEL